MNASQRIVFNIFFAYVRSVLNAGLALFSIRWVLSALGQTDFGLFNVVGSLILFITFLNAVMAASVVRHFAFAIGQGTLEEINRWFNAALSIHVLFSIVLIAIGWLIGEYVVTHVLTIPIDRTEACLWVFRISLIAAFVSMVSVPFVAMFTAMQRIAVISAWGILHSVMTFVLALSLTHVPGDRFLFYGAGMVVIIVVIQLAQVISAIVSFSECRIVFQSWFDRNRLREICTFAGWNLIGSLGGILRDHGSVILLNIYFGAKVNAAYSIASQVSSQTNHLATVLLGVFSPEIVTSEGRGDRARMLSLAQRASKIGTVLVLLFAVPLMVEVDYILTLWLRETPVYAPLLCQLMLAACILDRLSAGYMLAVNAHGRIAAYQVTLGTILVMTLPVAWTLLKMGAPPTSVGIAFIITMFAVSTGRVLWVRTLFGVSIRRWLGEVVLPSCIVGFAALSAAMMLQLFLHQSILRLIIIFAVDIMIVLLTSWYFTLDKDEHRFVKKNLRHLAIKMGIV